MRGLFTIGSVAVHAAVFGWLAWSGQQPKVRKATTVAVVQSKPKPPKEEEPKPEKEKPPPPPVIRPVVKQAALAPPAAAPPPQAAPAAPRFATGLTMGNGLSAAGAGIGVGAPATGGPPVPLESQAPRAAVKQAPPQPVADACDAADTKPKPLGAVQVEYPDQARADGIEGRIAVRIHVADDGSVASLELLEGVEASLDAAVLSILKRWTFAPATHCGKPVAGVLAWAQRFELGD